MYVTVQGGAYKDGPENIFVAYVDGTENFGQALQNKKDKTGRATHIYGPSLYAPALYNDFKEWILLKSLYSNVRLFVDLGGTQFLFKIIFGHVGETTALYGDYASKSDSVNQIFLESYTT